MISIVAALMLQGLAQAEMRPAPPPPPPPPPVRPEPARARANLASLISSDDYPIEALRREEEGIVGFRLQVGADGRVNGCSITKPSGSAALDSATCRLLTARARFTPARDSYGRPVADSVAARIVWRIQPRSLPPLEARTLIATLRASPQGQVSCSIVVNGMAMSNVSCPEAPSSMVEAARARGRTAEETMVETMTPVGQARPTLSGAYGVQLTEAEAVVRVAADGSILGCRVTRNDTLEAGAARRVRPGDPCKPYAFGSRKFEPATEGTAPRDVTVNIKLYRR